MVDRRHFKNFDFTLLSATLAIIAYGCAMIYSASSGGTTGAGYVEKQIIWALLGLIGAAVVASINHTVYHRHARKIYVITIVTLVAVLLVGESAKGAQRWIGYGWFRIQPSEFAKIALIIALAVFFVERADRIRSLRTLVESFVYLAVPLLLIFKQPDLGTSLVLLAIWITMAFVAGTDYRNIVLIAVTGIVFALSVWYIPGVLKDYQRKRIITLINPSADPLGSGYHINQSRIAVGSGQFLGKGFLKGTQRELRFIPEQHTDFIFTVVAEEFGFVGAVSLLGLYFLMIWRALNIMSVTEDSTGRLITAGVVGMFLFHVFVNVGMTLGIMPVTGVPLPLFSYGGSSLMANMMAIGLLEGISMRRHRISF
jgi:rod shape determining protein RodA